MERKKINEVLKLNEAVKYLPEVSTSKFTGSVNLDIVLNLKENQKKEIVRGSVNLPFSFGEDKKVIVICEDKDIDRALKVGALKAGNETLIKELEEGYMDFDILIATPALMPKLVRLGKVLGPKGLMPNPKNGTVTTDLEKSITSFKSGKINFKSTPDQNVVRLKVGKLNMKPEEIEANLTAVIKEVYKEGKKLNTPPFKKVTISPTMGTGIKVDVNDIIKSL